jgi:hypothetical protein
VAECLGEFETEFENILGVNQGLGAVDFWKKKQSRKSREKVSLNYASDETALHKK